MSITIQKEKILLFYLTLVLLCFDAKSQAISKYIVVDQIGYLPNSKKVAVIRDPQVGYDQVESFAPGKVYAVVNVATGSQVVTGEPVLWSAGTTDVVSGDKAWWYDFSSLTQPGTYYILDVEKNVRSYKFQVSHAVYNEVLKHAVRTFYYQRAGFAKTEQYAGKGWADGASHIGNLQDKNARRYNSKNDATTEVDVHGGWYDAGDYNKYTSWTASYVVEMMRAYEENPLAWGDNYGLPESGNGMPDLLDEAKWGLDFLLRMQQSDGGVLSIVGLSHASPPSAATGQSLYGTPSTSSTISTAAAYAIASKVFEGQGMSAYASTLKEAAIKAWDWAEANPNVLFFNNKGENGTAGLGAGQQETDDYGRLVAKLRAACFLFEITTDVKYRDFFDNNYTSIHLKEWTFAYPFEVANQETLLHYTKLAGATGSVVADIKAVYKDAMNKDDNFPPFNTNKDPYISHLKDYTWGSNASKALKGLMFTDVITYNIDGSLNQKARDAAEGYVHYVHGVNPLNLVYLSNMYKYGGDNCVNEFYHTWFSDGSAKWDRVGTSTYGPPPGFLTGGPNPQYNWDGCCPGGCGNSSSVCTAESISPPKGQPALKSYKDFNTSWPLNSWEVTENSCAYQVSYIRLLSHLVNASYDCNGTKDGTAAIDVCGVCAGGTTGVTPSTDPLNCTPIVDAIDDDLLAQIKIYPNPTKGKVNIINDLSIPFGVRIMDSMGNKILTTKSTSDLSINMTNYPSGIYLIFINHGNAQKITKIIKN